MITPRSPVHVVELPLRQTFDCLAQIRKRALSPASLITVRQSARHKDACDMSAPLRCRSPSSSAPLKSASRRFAARSSAFISFVCLRSAPCRSRSPAGPPPGQRPPPAVPPSSRFATLRSAHRMLTQCTVPEAQIRPRQINLVGTVWAYISVPRLNALPQEVDLFGICHNPAFIEYIPSKFLIF